MASLLEFLTKICESSQDQLCKMWIDEEEGEELMEQPQLPQNALHLYRLQEVLMKIVNSNRPLLHQIRVWSVVSSFLVEVIIYNDTLPLLPFRQDHIRGVIVSMLASSVVYHLFEPWSGQAKNYKNRYLLLLS